MPDNCIELRSRDCAVDSTNSCEQIVLTTYRLLRFYIISVSLLLIFEDLTGRGSADHGQRHILGGCVFIGISSERLERSSDC